MIMCLETRKQGSPSLTSDVPFIQRVGGRGAVGSGDTICGPFCTRLALAGYEALTIMSLMGHTDLKTTMRYIRAVQL